MISESTVIFVKTLDPWWNLAVEEYLLDRVKKNQCILYLWQNQNTVVIGKHQNSWKECQIHMLENEGGKLARRLSGGGAVFHDTGNLNFTFIMNKENYNLEKQLSVILAAVRGLGIPAEISGRNDLVVEGHKFSGNAFCFRNQNAYHHGTILLSADFSKLSRYLQVSSEKIRSKGIESVRSRVVNLIEYNPSLTVNAMCDALVNELHNVYGYTPSIVRGTDHMDKEILKELYNKYASWEWRIGKTPDFNLNIERRFQWGGVEIGIKLENGIVKEASVYSDAMDEDLISILPGALEGRILNSSVLSKSILGLSQDTERMRILEDIACWVRGKNL